MYIPPLKPNFRNGNYLKSETCNLLIILNTDFIVLLCAFPQVRSNMVDGRPRMKDIIAAFDARHELLLSHLSELQVGSEEITGTGQLTDEGLGDKNISSVHQANLAYHPKLLRTNSDGLINQPLSIPSGTSRCLLSLQSPSTSKLPRIKKWSIVQDQLKTMKFKQ